MVHILKIITLIFRNILSLFVQNLLIIKQFLVVFLDFKKKASFRYGIIQGLATVLQVWHYLGLGNRPTGMALSRDWQPSFRYGIIWGLATVLQVQHYLGLGIRPSGMALFRAWQSSFRYGIIQGLETVLQLWHYLGLGNCPLSMALSRAWQPYFKYGIIQGLATALQPSKRGKRSKIQHFCLKIEMTFMFFLILGTKD